MFTTVAMGLPVTPTHSPHLLMIASEMAGQALRMTHGLYRLGVKVHQPTVVMMTLVYPAF